MARLTDLVEILRTVAPTWGKARFPKYMSHGGKHKGNRGHQITRRRGAEVVTGTQEMQISRGVKVRAGAIRVARLTDLVEI